MKKLFTLAVLVAFTAVVGCNTATTTSGTKVPTGTTPATKAETTPATKTEAPKTPTPETKK